MQTKTLNKKVEFTLNLEKMLIGERNYARAVDNLTMFLKKLKPIDIIEEQILDKWLTLARSFCEDQICFDYQLRAFEQFKKHKEFIPHLNTIAHLYCDKTGKLSLISKKGKITIYAN
jgi:hypothetical protein